MSRSSEAEKFDSAMDKLLRVPPQIVKDAMEAEKKQRAQKAGHYLNSTSEERPVLP